MSDEQRVRTMAGWIGVEISKSRVRTEGKAGFGLYRVRGSVGMTWRDAREFPRAERTLDLHGRRTAWTGYAYSLEEIERAAQAAIDGGTPERPGLFEPAPYGDRRQALAVPVRWTSAYGGRRDLGVVGALQYCPHGRESVREGDGRLAHVDDGLHCDPASVRRTQRAANAAFQVEHKRRRDWGLARRHATKLRNIASHNKEGR